MNEFESYDRFKVRIDFADIEGVVTPEYDDHEAVLELLDGLKRREDVVDVHVMMREADGFEQATAVKADQFQRATV